MILISDLTEGGWFDGLPPDQLELIETLLSKGSSEETVAELWLSRTGSSSTAGFGTGVPLQSFFANVRREFVDFVCGDPKYDAERSQALTVWKEHGKVGLVSTVSAIVASTVGLAAAAVIPVIALLFSLTARIGNNAFCATCRPATS